MTRAAARFGASCVCLNNKLFAFNFNFRFSQISVRALFSSRVANGRELAVHDGDHAASKCEKHVLNGRQFRELTVLNALCPRRLTASKLEPYTKRGGSRIVALDGGCPAGFGAPLCQGQLRAPDVRACCATSSSMDFIRAAMLVCGICSN
jgi:hypothetical protein